MLVPEADGLKRFRRFGAHHVVCDAPEPGTALNRAHRRGDHHRCRPQLPHRGHSRFHRCPRRHAIVNEDDGPLFQRRHRALPAIGRLAAFELEALADRNLFDGAPRDAEFIDEVLAEDAHVAAGNRTHRQLGMAWDAELPNHKHVQGSLKVACDLKRDRNASARQRQHHDIGPVSVSAEAAGQLTSRVGPISEGHNPDSRFE